jgi:hypothetical protein
MGSFFSKKEKIEIEESEYDERVIVGDGVERSIIIVGKENYLNFMESFEDFVDVKSVVKQRTFMHEECDDEVLANSYLVDFISPNYEEILRNSIFRDNYEEPGIVNIICEYLFFSDTKLFDKWNHGLTCSNQGVRIFVKPRKKLYKIKI